MPRLDALVAAVVGHVDHVLGISPPGLIGSARQIAEALALQGTAAGSAEFAPCDRSVGAGLLAAVSLGAPSQPRQVSLLLLNATVVTMGGLGRVLAPGAVALAGRDIVAVGDSAVLSGTHRAAHTIDATGAVVMPGLINTHTHAPMVMYRGLADDLALADWLQQYIFPAEAGTVWDALLAAVAPQETRRLIDATFSLFEGEDLAGQLPRGELGRRGLVHETYRLVLSPALGDTAFGARGGATMLAAAG